MATIVGYTQVQYSGIWSLSGQANAKSAGTWAVPDTASLWSWGFNNQGQLGLNNASYVAAYSSPKQVGALANWVKVAAGSYNATVIKNDGSLWTWGFNYYGQLGIGDTTGRSSPVQIGTLKTWDQIASGSWGSAAIKTDGTLWTWGQGSSYGALGLGNTTNYSSPKQVGALNTWAFIATKSFSVGAIRTDGTLWTWGENDYGQLGLGTSGAGTFRSSPSQVGSLTNWSKIAFGVGFALAIKTDGSLWSWGSNNSGQLGIGNRTNYSSPKQVGALTNWAQVVGNQYSTLAVKTDGTLWSWGFNGTGVLGLGNTTYYSSPKQVGSLTNWSKVDGWQYYAIALKTNNTLWSWGYNNYGQLGQNNTTYYSSPKQVGSATNWYAIAGGQSQTIALRYA